MSLWIAGVPYERKSSLTSDTLDLCRAFFLKGKIGPRDHGPTFSSSEEEQGEKQKP